MASRIKLGSRQLTDSRGARGGANLHGCSGTGSELLHIRVVGLLISLCHNGHGGAIQDCIPPRQPQQRAGVADAAEREGALAHLACMLTQH